MTQIELFSEERQTLQRLVEEKEFSIPLNTESDFLDAFQLVDEALNRPIDFPQLKETVYPGDRIAIVVQPELPQLELVLKRLIQELISCNIEPPDVTLVITEATARKLSIEIPAPPESDPPSEVDDIDGEKTSLHYAVLDAYHSIGCHVHAPGDEDGLCYVAANREALPMMVSRPIAEADVVLPVGFPIVRKDSLRAVSLVDQTIYPNFSSLETLERFRATENQDELEAEIRLANDHLGIFSSLQVVPGPGDCIQSVFNGERYRVAEMAQSQFLKTWGLPSTPGECDVVILTVDGNDEEQTWGDVVQSIVFASELAPHAQQIVIWSELKQAPTRDLKAACRAQFEADERISSSKLNREMRRFADIVGRSGVFLHSRLGQAEIEGLGLGYVGSAMDLQRIIQNAQNGVFVADGHRCLLMGDKTKNRNVESNKELSS